MFREKFPLAWTFHRNSSRWPHNMLSGPTAMEDAAPYKEYLAAPLVSLPEPDFPPVLLHEAIAARLSCRRFAETPVSLAALSALLKAGYGVMGRYLTEQAEQLARPVPSGGALYPLEIYLLVDRVEGVAPGIYHYSILPHALEQIATRPLARQMVSDLFMFQPYVAEAALVIVLTAVVARTLKKYTERGYRYILFEAGHAAQNLNLMGAALGLGSVNLGGFFDAALGDLLGLDAEAEVPLYGLAVGVPASRDPVLLRQPPAY